MFQLYQLNCRRKIIWQAIRAFDILKITKLIPFLDHTGNPYSIRHRVFEIMIIPCDIQYAQMCASQSKAEILVTVFDPIIGWRKIVVIFFQ